jgi:hypothetical protein
VVQLGVEQTILDELFCEKDCQSSNTSFNSQIRR